jgi:hypothetical protein
MVHGWLVGSPLASGVCVGWWEGVDEKEEEEDGGAQKEKPKNRHHPAFFPRLSQYPKCGIFWKGKNTPNWFTTSFFFSFFTFSGTVSPIRNCHERVWTLDPNSRVGSSVRDD